MSFVVRKPRLPIGTPVRGFHAVERALHVDASCEVYLLENQPGNDVLLVLAPLANSSAPAVVERLTRWWTLLGPDRVLLKDTSDGQNESVKFVLQVSGEWAGVGARPEIEEPKLLSMLVALLDLAEAAAKEDLRPAFQPSLLWISCQAGVTQVVPIVAESLDSADQCSAIVSFATIVFWIAAGLDVNAVINGQSPPALSRWCKAAGSGLSGLIGRCLAREGAPDRIDSLAELRFEIVGLGSRRSGTVEHPPAGPSSGLPGLPSGAGGLAKVAGMHELKDLLQREVVKPLRDPEPFRRYGLTVPNGILLYGPPGCGKTYIARQLAEELTHFFVEIIPSEIASPYVHQSVLRIRELFDTAAEHAPAVIFIDEFEALVPSRAGLGGHQQYKSEEVNEFLAHLNSCAAKQIFVIAATNEPENIDAAIRRTGRLDKLIYVGPPDFDARGEMLRLHLAGRPVSDSLDINALAQTLEGYSASDIKFLVDEAARSALEKETAISTEILVEALRRVPPSVTRKDEERYKTFTSRGV